MIIRRCNNAFKLLVLMVSVMLVSCAVRDGAPESYSRDWNAIEDAVPRHEPFSRYGNPDNYEVFGVNYQVMEKNTGFSQQGLASWYGTKFHGQRTSSGEAYDMFAMTAAHKSLRIPTYVEVTNLDNKRTAIVKVNDRGPFHEGRIIDLSYAAATRLGVAETGTARVTIRVVEIEKSPQETLVNNGSDKVSTASLVLEDSEVTSSVKSPVEFYVQVAAFSSEENAKRMRDDLNNKGFNSVRIHVEGVPEKLLYRVRIGPLLSRLVAEKLVTQLKEINHDNVRIVASN